MPLNTQIFLITNSIGGLHAKGRTMPIFVEEGLSIGKICQSAVSSKAL
jgi:hypothetical protein